MTRETKIGLLVGLVFIILFGLILGERTNSLPEQAAETIPVRNNGNPFGGPLPMTAQTPSHGSVVPAHNTQESHPEAEHGAAEPVRPTDLDNADRGEPLPRDLGSDTGALSGAPVVLAAGTPYTIVASDTLIKIARKIYGEDNWRQYKKIYEANKDKLASESANLTVGDKLIIPAPDIRPTVAPSESNRSDVRRMSRDELVEYMRGTGSAERGAPPAASRGSYTTQRGDSLSSVARKKLGNDKPETLKKLFEANRDKLSSPDQMKVGLALMIPQ